MAAPHGTLPRLARTPLMHCRHAVGNYIGLFKALFEIFYEIGQLDGPLVIQPDGTLGSALAVNEQALATKLAAGLPSGRESVLLGLVRTILSEDSGMAPDAVEAQIKLMRQLLENAELPTFAEKGDALEFSLGLLAGTPLGSTQAQADEIVATFRSLGKIVTDLVGLEFPRLVDWRIDLGDEPERWVELTGFYTVVLPSQVEDLLDVGVEDGRLTLELHIDTVRLHGSATARFFRIDPRGRNEGEEQERLELLLTLAENALGTFELHGLTLALQLDDQLDDGAREPFAPRHRMRLADWARPGLKVNVDSAHIVIHQTWVTSLLGLLAMGLGIDLEPFLEERVVDYINGRDDLAQLGESLRDYVGPVADRLIPRAYVAEIVRYRDPFVRLRPIAVNGDRPFALSRPTRWEPEVELTFAGLDTLTERGGVAVRNLAPDPIEIEGEPINGPDHRPGNLEDLDPPAGDWAWPSTRPGGLTQLDLDDPVQRGHALAALASVPELTPRARAMAALSVHGLDPHRIGALRRDAVDLRAGTVLGRPVPKQALEWVAEAMRDGDHGVHVFRAADYPAGTALVSAELRHVQQALVLRAGIGRPPEPGGALVRPFDVGIWTMDHDPRTPLPRNGGSPRDPAWYGLSTNCVVATTIYRSLRESGQLERTGTARSGARTLAWRVEDCVDVAADFSGRAPGDAPALALAQVVVGIGPDFGHLARWRADVRLRLQPRFHGSGCLPDASVRTVLAELACIEAMARGEVPDVARLRELEFRGFMVLAADLADRARDIELVSLVDAAGAEPPSGDPVHTDLRDALADWLAGLPEVPVLYNPFRSIPGASDRSFVASAGWLCVERRYRFPDLAGISFD